MKRIYFILMLVVMSLTSCNLTEEITFNKDGSGTFTMGYDMATLMEKMKEKGLGGDEFSNEEARDSVFYFKDVFAEVQDSISKLSLEEQKKIKAMENVAVRMRMDPKNGVFDMGIGTSFKSFNELPEMLDALNEAKEMNAKNDKNYGQLGQTAIGKSSAHLTEDVDYNYDGKRFSRVWKGDVSRTDEEAKKVKEEIEKMGEMKSFFEEMTYKLKYTFPRKIKSVSNKKAVISKDKKTVTLEVDFLSLVKSPELLNLEVKLK